MSGPQTDFGRLDPAESYERSMTLIRERFVSLDSFPIEEASLVRAERVAFQVRKIIEGIAFAALSAVEHRNRQTLANHRTKPADKLLKWLADKQLLRLPSAQRLERSSFLDYKAVFNGAAAQDMDLGQLMDAYARASSLIHERHPERLTPERIASGRAAIEEDAHRLRSWLWLHIMFLKGEGFLIQMGLCGTSSFFVPLTRVGDLPADLRAP